MNGTPHYGFHLHLCGLDGIDRELKRVEDKVDARCSCRCREELASHKTDPRAHGPLFDAKVDKRDGCRLICENELADICEALGDRYTRAEADALLEKRVRREPGKVFDLELAAGLTPRHADTQPGQIRCSYSKDPFGTVTVRIAVQSEDKEPTLNTNGMEIAVLPEGFRPAGGVIVSGTGHGYQTGGVLGTALYPAVFRIDANGIIRLDPYRTEGFFAAFTEFSFPAA